MSSEKADFRDNLARITERFSTELIRVKEATSFLGVDAKSLNNDKTFPQKKVGGRWYVSAVALARWMS